MVSIWGLRTFTTGSAEAETASTFSESFTFFTSLRRVEGNSMRKGVVCFGSKVCDMKSKLLSSSDISPLSLTTWAVRFTKAGTLSSLVTSPTTINVSASWIALWEMMRTFGRFGSVPGGVHTSQRG